MAGWQFRPAKHIQRLMAVDVMRRLSVLRPLKQYRYVGFGGYEFVDFDLVHRQLGIDRMTSIESSSKLQRFEFNRPFPDIVVLGGTSNDVLQTIPLDDPLIVWLDYCKGLRRQELQDVRLLGEHLRPGSMLLVTVNAATPEDGTRIDVLTERVGSERIPLHITEERHLDGWDYAITQRRILADELHEGIAARGPSRRFEQLLDVHYRDTQRMQTWGGLIADEGYEARVALADFSSLDQVRRAGEAPLRISVPVLTVREVLKLEEGLSSGGATPRLPWLKDSESDSFTELHRWYPPVPAPM